MSEVEDDLVVNGPDKKTALHMIDLLVKSIKDGTSVVMEIDMGNEIGRTYTTGMNHSFTGARVMKIFYRRV